MKILITGAWKIAQEQLNQILSLGHSVVFMQNENQTLPCDYKEIDAVICNGLFLYHDIKKFTSLKFIQLTSAGYDRMPLEYVRQHDIKIYNARGVYSVPMAEFAICGVLQLYKQSKFFINHQKERVWEKHRELKELYGKVVCVIGCGSVGNECAKRFSAFGCEILGVDLYPRIDNVYDKMVHLDYLNKVVVNADIVILTLPLTKETKGFFGKKLFDCMKDGSVLVNISRGAIVDEKELLVALENKLFGAVLDVFEEEPLNMESPLWQMENVLLSPHNSFAGEGNLFRLNNLILANIQGINEKE